ncbi:MAG: hypothetical protein QM648_11140 [Solirubrobacterales bacterium]
MGQRSRRKAAIFVNVISIVVCLLVVTGAAARVSPILSTSLTTSQVVTGPTGATSLVTSPAGALGQHGDYTLNMTFDYGATGTIPLKENGSASRIVNVQDPATYPAGSDDAESVGNIVVDLPPGLVGNPQAIPYDERCDVATFETGTCPDSSVVGELTIGVTLVQMSKTENEIDWYPPEVGDTGYLNFKMNATSLLKNGRTRVALLKTDPEVPAKIGIMVKPPQVSYANDTHDVISVAPDTQPGSALQLRSIVSNVSNWLTSQDDDSHTGNFRIDYMNLRLDGRLANGHAFMTNPTSCQKWDTTIWTNAHYVNDNLAADPLGSGAPQFAAPASSSITPDCTNQGSLAFPIAGDVAISTPDRNTSPAFDFTITNPGLFADGDVSTSPKQIVTTVPASINVDVGQLGRVCQVADFDADTCAASARVGTVAIETPLLRTPLGGDVYLVKQDANSGLPDLGLRVRGAINFTVRGTNKYVGESYNQIETNFDNIPQIGFSKLTFHLFGGDNGLLRSLKCPTYNKVPAIPNFTYNFTAYTGATATSTTPLNMTNCFGVQELKTYPQCLHKKLPIHPNYQSRSRVRQVRLYIDGKLRRTTKKSPFRFDLQLGSLKLKQTKGRKHSFKLRAIYDDDTVSEKTANFKTCK